MDKINEDILEVKSPRKKLTQLELCEGGIEVPSKRFADKET